MDINNFAGFTVTSTKKLTELKAELIRMTHKKTGLELVWLKRNEQNKTFGIAFETLPFDDTGVFHILEHSVLCGSKNYPVKEPFVELMKSSMNTFLNALTFPDKTFYPISSRNDKDFINLMRVYLDAVFYPSIYEKPEIFYQEGWHYEFDQNGNVGYKGVVFNEMKGVFASPDELIVNGLNRELFPNSPYRFVSGGDPSSIPNLTYEKFIESHKRFYSPSNAYVFLDGDINIETVLSVMNNEYLENFEKTERLAPPEIQQPVIGETTDTYELAQEESLSNKTLLSYGKVIGTFDQREKIVAAGVLADVLCGTNQSVLSKAVLSDGLAEDVSIAINDGVLQPWLTLNVKNIDEKNIEKIENLITAKLTDIAEKGIDRNELEAVMANTEFKMRERDYGFYPQGIIFGFSALETWLYGGDPSANLEVGDLFVKLKEKMNHGYFEQLIKELFLENNHSAKIVLTPSHTVGEQRRNAEQQRITAEIATWDKNKLAETQQKEQNLIAWQESEDTPETLATIPQLEISDIPTEPEKIPTEVLELNGIKCLKHEISTGGIIYVSLYFNADFCNEQQLKELSFASMLLGETETENYSAEQVINKLRLLCGDFAVLPATYEQSNNSNKVLTKLCVHFSTLESNLKPALELIAEILTKSKFSNDSTHDILRQVKMSAFQKAVMSGNSVALGRVAAQNFAGGVIDEMLSGIEFYKWLKNTDENWDFEKLNVNLTEVLEKVINKNGITVSVSGSIEGAEQTVAEFVNKAFAEKPQLPKTEFTPWGTLNEGIIVPADVSFAVMGGNIKQNGNSIGGQMQLATQVISLAYLWNVVRVQGGAYGTGIVSRNNGLTACYSYRDPNGAESLNKYKNCGAFLKDIVSSGEDLTGFIIGAVSNSSPLMTPKTKARLADSQYFSNITWEERVEKRKQLLNSTSQDLLKIAEQLEKTLNNGGICILGNATQIEKVENLDKVITL